jgi:hypothetical protein
MKQDGPALLIAAGCGLAIALLALSPIGGGLGSLLVVLCFWIALAQGGIAVAATCDLVNARWIASVKPRLLALTPLLLLLTILFLLLWPELQHYPWSGMGGRYLNADFFMGRNLVALLLTYAAALAYVSAALRGTAQRQKAAVIYLFLFVICQSLVAFDWVMSLEYPWYSSMFGIYFFIESLYAGLAVAGLLFWWRLRTADREQGQVREHLSDLATLIFGFSILWGGLFFAQYVVIWYGNLPEETGFIVRRTSSSPYLQMAWLFLGCNFLIPFLGLLSARVKNSPALVGAISLVILVGLLIERLLYILPVLAISPLPALAQFSLLGLAFVVALRHRSTTGDRTEEL